MHNSTQPFPKTDSSAFTHALSLRDNNACIAQFTTSRHSSDRRAILDASESGAAVEASQCRPCFGAGAPSRFVTPLHSIERRASRHAGQYFDVRGPSDRRNPLKSSGSAASERRRTSRSANRRPVASGWARRHVAQNFGAPVRSDDRRSQRTHFSKRARRQGLRRSPL